MNRIIWTIIVTFTLSAGNVSATQFVSPKGNDSVIGEDYDDDVFLTGNTIRFDGKVRGDLYVACNELVQSDSVEGNLSMACKSIQSLGPVGRSFLGFAYDINCNAPVERNLMAFANKIIIGPETSVGKDANLFAGTVVFQGNVDGNLKIRSDNATVSGSVAGNLNFEGGTLTLSSDAVINGDLIYCSPDKAEMGDMAAVNGEVKWTKCVREDNGGTSTGRVLTWLISHRGYFLSLTVFSLLMFIFSAIPFPTGVAMVGLAITLLISGNLFIMISKKMSHDTEMVLNKKALPSIGLGFVLLFLSPIAAIVLLFSVFGAPLGAILILMFGVACFAGCVYAALFIGRNICRLLNIGSPLSTGYECFSIGIVLIVVVSYIPIIGYIVALLVTMMGIGGLAQALYGKRQESALPE